jgi:hypothetical protein
VLDCRAGETGLDRDAGTILGYYHLRLYVRMLRTEALVVVEHLDGPRLCQPAGRSLPAQIAEQRVVLLYAYGPADGKYLLLRVLHDNHLIRFFHIRCSFHTEDVGLQTAQKSLPLQQLLTECQTPLAQVWQQLAVLQSQQRPDFLETETAPLQPLDTHQAG